MKRLLPPVLALAVVLGALALAHFLGGPASAPVQAVIARCLIDSQTDAVYAANDSGGIDALSQGSGRLLWSTTEATDPMTVHQDRLLAWVAEPGQPNRIRVVALEIRRGWLRGKGTRTLTSDPIIFPEWVSVTPANGRSFQAEARGEGGDLLLRWKAKARYAGGVDLGREVEERARKDASGVARINLASGQVAMLGPEAWSSWPILPPDLYELAKREYTDELYNRETKALVAEGRVVALDEEFLHPGQRLVLRRWDVASGKELGPITLVEGESIWFKPLPDGRSVLVGEPAPIGQVGVPGAGWLLVFSLPTGERLARFPFQEGAAELTVVGHRAFFVTYGVVAFKGDFEVCPRTLRVVDVNSGNLLWERPVASLRTPKQPL